MFIIIWASHTISLFSHVILSSHCVYHFTSCHSLWAVILCISHFILRIAFNLSLFHLHFPCPFPNLLSSCHAFNTVLQYLSNHLPTSLWPSHLHLHLQSYYDLSNPFPNPSGTLFSNIVLIWCDIGPKMGLKFAFRKVLFRKKSLFVILLLQFQGFFKGFLGVV